MEDNGRVLAICAHPDDVEFMCGGTLALFAQKGYEVHSASMTAGNGGSQVMTAFEIGNTRRREAADAAAVIGAKCYCLEVDDLCIDVTDPLRRKVTGLIRLVDPFLIICPPLQDYLFDHENTAVLVRDASFCAPVPLYAAFGSAKSTASPACLYYGSPSSGYGNDGEFVRLPTVIDISSVIETKKKMLACHASQREWLRAKHGMDEYIDTGLTWSADTGKPHGYAYAEGFRQHLGPFYPHDDMLLKILS